MTQPTRGVFYVATGAEHYAVAERSARSVLATNPDLGRCICTDMPADPSVFDTIIPVENPHHRSKVDYMGRSPFDYTLYLDGDTIVRSDLGSFFDILDAFDIALTHVVLWENQGHQMVHKVQTPDAFAEPNTGVILFKKSAKMDAFLTQWKADFDDMGSYNDQVTMRELLWRSDIRCFWFPPQFNKRVFEASELIYSDAPKARIFHLELLAPQKNRFLRWLATKVK